MKKDIPKLEKKVDEKLQTSTPVSDKTLSKDPEQQKKDEAYAAKVKELEQAFFTMRFYPVAVKEQAKEEAREKIKKHFKEDEETVRQLVLYMIHEHLSQASELKTMYNFDFFKGRMPTVDPAQLRMNVYRAMFNYNYSLEGIIELLKLLGELEGDDAAKLLTYHFSFYSCIEVESMHMLRNAAIEALGESNSEYALQCLLRYAHYSDNERMLQRFAIALTNWSNKLDTMKISQKDKDRLKAKLHEVMTAEFGDSHYG